MIATYINAVTVVVGAAAGLLLRRFITERFRGVVTSGIGVVTLVLGFRLSFESQQIVYLALAITIGGLLGEWWQIEAGITRLGEGLHRLLPGRPARGRPWPGRRGTAGVRGGIPELVGVVLRRRHDAGGLVPGRRGRRL